MNGSELEIFLMKLNTVIIETSQRIDRLLEMANEFDDRIDDILRRVERLEHAVKHIKENGLS